MTLPLADGGILTDGDAVRGQRASTGRSDTLDRDGGCQVAGFIPVEIDLEGAANVWLVVRVSTGLSEHDRLCLGVQPAKALGLPAGVME